MDWMQRQVTVRADFTTLKVDVRQQVRTKENHAYNA
jgi:hypothetical protein